MSYLNTTFGKIYYEEVGEGEPLLFIHGRTLDSRMWDYQVDSLKGEYRCIRYDLDGFGRSQVPTDGYSRVGTLYELITHLNIPSVNIIALSLGTHVALSFAVKYPKKVKSLSLLSPTIPGANYSQEFIHDWEMVEEAGKKGDFDRAKELWINCRAFKNLGVSNPHGYKLLKTMINDYTCWDIHNPPLHKSEYTSVVELLSQIRVPTLVMYGSHDYEDFINNANMLKHALPNVKVVEVKNSSHMVNMEYPEMTNQSLDNFLREIVG